MNLEPFISQILETYGRGDYYEEIKRAKEHYFSKAFKVAEGSDRYEIELNLFFDWFVFERNLERENMTPIDLFNKDEAERIEEADKKKVFSDLSQSFSSVFEMVKVCLLPSLLNNSILTNSPETLPATRLAICSVITTTITSPLAPVLLSGVLLQPIHP